MDKRSVTVDGRTYYVTIRPSAARHRERFGTLWYALVELPGEWEAVLPAPTGISSAARLWFREVIELIEGAHEVVAMREGAA